MNKLFTILTVLFISLSTHAEQNDYLIGQVLKCDFIPNCIDVNKENDKLIIGGENEVAIVYDLTNKKKIFEQTVHYQPVVEVQFSNKHDGFYTVGDKSFKLWLFGSEKEEKLYKGSHTSITEWEMTPDEKHFVGGSYEKKFRYWDANNPETPQTVQTGQKKNVISIALSNDNKYIACGSLDHTIEIYQTDSMKLVKFFEAHAEPVSCLKFTPDGKYLISGSHDGHVKIWSTDNYKIKKVFSGHTNAINNISISTDGHYILAASYDNSISLFSIPTEERIYHYIYHKAPVLDVCWRKDGKGFYSCDKEGFVIEWNVPNSLFVDHYFSKEMNQEIENNTLFAPRTKEESKDDYKQRMEKAEDEKKIIFEKYYQKYLKLLNDSEYKP